MYIVLLSTQLHVPTGENSEQIFRDNIFLRDEFPVMKLTQKLLNLYLDSDLRKYRPPKSVFSTLLSFSYSAYEMMFLEDDKGKEIYCSPSDQSLLLLLVLISEPKNNPFLNVLKDCYDANFLLDSQKEKESIHVSYSKLYDTISTLLAIHDRGASLILLSHLLQHNSLFLSYVFSRSDLEIIVCIFIIYFKHIIIYVFINII